MGECYLMAKVSEVIEWLSQREPDEEIALTGWWYKDDVENNNEVELTDDQWLTVVSRHENNTERDIDDVVSEVLEMS
jgi:hypothetical protein